MIGDVTSVKVAICGLNGGMRWCEYVLMIGWDEVGMRLCPYVVMTDDSWDVVGHNSGVRRAECWDAQAPEFVEWFLHKIVLHICLDSLYHQPVQVVIGLGSDLLR
eukprot:1339662-Amorphochlora_amoeboformis.AAC.1